MTHHPLITCASPALRHRSTPHQPPYENHDDIALNTNDLLEDGNNGQEATEDDHVVAITTSALIAHTYRLAAEHKCDVPMQLFPTGNHASFPDLWHTDTRSNHAIIEDGVQDSDERPRTRLENSLSVLDMLCSVPPSIVDNTVQTVSKETQEENDCHSILYTFRRVPHAIISDSIRPSLAPHIVITPPPESWEDSISSYDNRINPQNTAFLYVPPINLSTCRMATCEEWRASVLPRPQVNCRIYSPFGSFNYFRFCRNIRRAVAERSSFKTRAASLATHRLMHRYVAIVASQQASTFCRQSLCEYIDNTRNSRSDPKKMVPSRVFSPSLFKAFVAHTRDERVHPMTEAAVYATHRLLLRLEAIRASSIATEWRSRYDDAQFLAIIDRRFKWKWNDPAEPVFSYFGPRPLNVTILHSSYPCSAPHIVIHGTESNDPWITWGNSTDVQDCSYGNNLVVMSAKGHPLQYINVTGDEPTDYFGDTDSHGYDEFGGSSDSSSLCSSSSGLETPTELRRVGSGFFSDDPEEDSVKCCYESYSSYITSHHADIPSAMDTTSSQFTSPGHTSTAKFYLASDDDDDGPPEYDEWFISIANRTGITREIGLTANLFV